MSFMKMNKAELGLGMAVGCFVGGLAGLMLGKRKKRISCMIRKLIQVVGGIAEIVLP